MAEFVNKTFDDGSSLIKYFPEGNWTHLQDPSSTTLYNNTTSLGDLVRSPLDQNVSFTFPEKAIAFYYYGNNDLDYVFAICIDNCDSPNESTTFEEVNTTASDGGASHQRPPLYSKRFETPGIHTIVLRPSADILTRKTGMAVDAISIDRFDLEVANPNASSTSPSPTSTPPSPSPTSLQRQPPDPSEGEDVPMIVGGIIGGCAVTLCILCLWFLCYRRRRRIRDQNRREALQPFSPSAPSIAQTRVAGKVPTPTRIATVIASGKRVVRNVVPGISIEREEIQSIGQQYEVDAGPVNESVSDTREMMPPQYEQVFRDPAGREESEPSRGAEVHETRRKLS